MPKANRATTPVAVDLDLLEGRYADLGDVTVGFETFPHDVDPAPYFNGLLDDRCPCPHWGIVVAGMITFRWPDRLETYAAGDAYYAPPGHLPLISAGTSVVEFSPSADLERTMAVLDRNLRAAGVLA